MVMWGEGKKCSEGGKVYSSGSPIREWVQLLLWCGGCEKMVVAEHSMAA